MNFFNDIGRAFQNAGNTINNEVIKPTTVTLNPNQNGSLIHLIHTKVILK